MPPRKGYSNGRTTTMPKKKLQLKPKGKLQPVKKKTLSRKPKGKLKRK